MQLGNSRNHKAFERCSSADPTPTLSPLLNPPVPLAPLLFLWSIASLEEQKVTDVHSTCCVPLLTLPCCHPPSSAVERKWLSILQPPLCVFCNPQLPFPPFSFIWSVTRAPVPHTNAHACRKTDRLTDAPLVLATSPSVQLCLAHSGSCAAALIAD